MDFISNLIKRPISLVINETVDSMDKYSATESSSASLPSNFVDNSKVKKSASEDREINRGNNNNVTSSNMSSSCHAGGDGGDNITDFIGVPEGYLGEFEDILPPPPLPLQSNCLLDIEITRSLSVTPPPPPPPTLTEQELETMLTPSMKASQTIDELLSHINDNLQQAGLNDDVLAIAAPSNKLELNPLSGKATLNNVKQITTNTPKTPPTTAAGTAVTVFENNSSLHKFHIDPELEAGLFDDHHQEQQHLENQDQHVATKDHNYLNTTGVNKLSTKFVGLTEFDETKIPELPGDLNPNIEEQYNVTFEECFIPTLTARQEIKVSDEIGVDRTHILLPIDVDTISSDNETFADCNDGKDPLATTFAETDNLDATTDLESYRSAVNNTMNDTMENIADITRETEADLQNAHETQVMEECKTENNQQYEPMQEVDPMDVDLNSTLKIIQNTSNNIENVEKVIQHAENILQHIEEIKPIEDSRQENSTLAVNTTVECPLGNTQNLEIEQSKHELVLNKSVELSLDNKNLSSECIIDKTKNENNVTVDGMKSSVISNSSTKSTGDSGKTKNENNELQSSKTEITNNLNVTVDAINSNLTSNSSTKSTDDLKGETKLNLNNSATSQKSSAPSSPSFPIKNAQTEGFPRSPKAVMNKQPQSPFLEKSDYLDNLQSQSAEKSTFASFNGKENEENYKNINGISVELNSDENSTELKRPNDEKCQIVGIDSSMPETNQNKELETNSQVNEMFPSQTSVEEKRRTFTVPPQESQGTKLQFPATVDKPADTGIFSVNETSSKHEKESTASKIEKRDRRTFNIETKATEQIAAMNTSCEPMDVDDYVPVAITDKDKQPPSPAKSVIQESSQRSKSPAGPADQQRTRSPPLPSARPQSQSPPLPAMQRNSHSPPLSVSQTASDVQQRSHSSPLSTLQERTQSPPLPTRLQRSQSPPIPTIQARQQEKSKIQPVKLSSLQQQTNSIKGEKISPTLDNNDDIASSTFNPQSQPLSTLIQKRPPIRDVRSRPDVLSEKEQNNIKVKDEKDVFVEKFTPSPTEEVFTAVTATSTTLSNASDLSEFDQNSSSSSSLMNKNTEQQNEQQEQFGENFGGNNNIILNPSDFDYLLTKGNNDTPVSRSSLLLKFDPFLGVPVPVNQGPQQQQQLQQQLLQLQIPTNTINPRLSPTFEEDEHTDSNRSFVIETKSTNGCGGKTAVDGVVGELTETSAKLLKGKSQDVKPQLKFGPQAAQENKSYLKQGVNKKNATMSVDVIKDMSLDNDCNKAFENSNSTQSDDKQINYKMDELEKKIKNEVLKTEDIEKKLKDAEQREEALIKRITEKDKTISKMNGVIEAYEKAIAELIAEKEQLIQNYEKQLAEVKADRDSNYHHLTSLETTFSDLHVKYEKSKEMTCQLKASEEALQAEKRKNLENLHLQEQRYDKMKNHAMQQLEIANKKLESLTRDHSIEITKLKALLKKEEIARSSITEQLSQKSKENAELVKICDELIANQGS